MGGSPSPPAQQTVTQKTEIDPIQKSFLFGTKLPAEYKSQIMARNQNLGLNSGGSSGPSGNLNTLEGRLAAGMLVEQEPPLFQSPSGGPFGETKTYVDPVTNMQYRGSGDTLTPYTSYDQAQDAQKRQDAMRKADGGLVTLANGGMVPPMMNGSMPNLSNREQAYLMGAQALQGAMQPQPQQRPMQSYAVGGYVEGPGTGRSDSIPATIYQDGQPVQDAALSDGEFVMTERAVRGAGAGDREAGAARMYEMMRRFENGGRVS